METGSLHVGRTGWLSFWYSRHAGISNFKGSQAEVTTGTFHPAHHRVLCTGDIKGKFMYWIAGSEEPQVSIPFAHESAIWDIAFSPLGNVVATASGDTATKFWCRPRPGDETNAVRTKDQAELETSEAWRTGRRPWGELDSLPWGV